MMTYTIVKDEDPTKLSMAVSNLMNNAHWHPHGSLCVTKIRGGAVEYAQAMIREKARATSDIGAPRS